jgi:hypothetical protein
VIEQIIVLFIDILIKLIINLKMAGIMAGVSESDTGGVDEAWPKTC